jgi:hypothetical protein
MSVHANWYKVNVNEDDLEVIHRNPPLPQCNEQMMLEDITIDVASVKRMVREGKARYCQHCFPSGSEE